MFLIGQLILLKNPPILTGDSLLLPRRASYEAEWFDVALRFVYLSLGEISSANTSQKLKKSSEVNSLPRSDLRHLILWSDSFSTKILKALNFSKASSLCFRSPIQQILEKLSMNNIKYSSPRGDFFLDGPHKSVWTSSSGLLADPSFLGKCVLVCLPNWHDFHVVLSGIMMSRR